MIHLHPGRIRRFSWVGCAIAAGLIVSAGCQRDASPATADPAATAGSATEAVAPAEPAAAIARLKGRWLRPDGDYVLAVGEIDAEGRAEARYFNPSPINVAWARVRTHGGQVNVEVELRDTNYPGCLYKLRYLPESDRLVGTYFQAQMQQTHEVMFIRQP
jgi:hypothetical protein